MDGILSLKVTATVYGRIVPIPRDQRGIGSVWGEQWDIFLKTECWVAIANDGELF
jgi:hypothetical protein